MPIYKKVNKDFFKKWTPEMAYVLGFFVADGNIIQNKRRACFISFEICDLDILMKIQHALGSNHKIGERTNKNNHQKNSTYRLQIGSKDIFDDLLNLGFSPNKVKSMTPPLVPDKFFPHFVRGYFDGDGNVWSGHTHKERKTLSLIIQTIFTSCSYTFLDTFMKRLEKYKIIGRLRKEKSYYRLVYSINSSIRLFTFMYYGYNGHLYLKRKKVIFCNYLRIRNRKAPVA